MKEPNKTDTVSWDDHLDHKYGKKGSQTRALYEEQFDVFKLGFIIQQARKKKKMTQTELAAKVGTTKNYISRIENNASDIRLSTLMRIITEGLDGQLKLSVELD